MRKTEEEILRDKIHSILSNSGPFTKKNIEGTTSLIITAMQTFAQQESIMFAEWKDNNTKESPYVVGKFEYKKGLYTTAQLYAIYLKNKF